MSWSDSSARSAMAALAASAQEAAHRLGLHELDLLIGGRRVRLRLAGAELARQMTRAFVPLVAAGGEPDLTVLVWDSGASGVALPVEAGRPADHVRDGFGLLKQDGAIVSLFDGEATLSLLDREQRLAVYWIADAAHLSEHNRAAPLQSILGWWLTDWDSLVVHASGVVLPRGAALLLGPSGAGKSTTALACVEQGFGYLGDDLCAVSLTSLQVESLYYAGKVFRDNLARFPPFAAAVVNGDQPADQKAIGYLTDWQGAALCPRAPLRALVALTAKGADAPCLLPLSPARALQALGPSNLFTLPGRGQGVLAVLASLVRRVPCYELRLAADLDANPGVLRALLQAEE